MNGYVFRISLNHELLYMTLHDPVKRVTGTCRRMIGVHKPMVLH